MNIFNFQSIYQSMRIRNFIKSPTNFFFFVIGAKSLQIKVQGLNCYKFKSIETKSLPTKV